jgi:hypothetical protein
MTDATLHDFLVTQKAQFEKLEALADVVSGVKSPAQLGDSYRKFIEALNAAWLEIQQVERENPPAGKDSRWGWFNSVLFALSKAHATSRPAINSRNLSEIGTAVYSAHGDILDCRLQLDAELQRLNAM